MFINSAMAASGQTVEPSGGDMLMSLFPLILVLIIFYFLLLRPQQKRIRAHMDMIGALSKGDKVVTGGGLVGTVIKMSDEDEVIVEIAEGVKVKAVRSTITAVVNKKDTK